MPCVLAMSMYCDGRNLWVVGDARQSIYRFRGASATNIARFAIDFPGAQAAQLGVNYRSDERIVDVFTEFARGMQASAGALPLNLLADRGSTGERVELRVAGSADDEISALAASITALHEQGIAYGGQALVREAGNQGSAGLALAGDRPAGGRDGARGNHGSAPNALEGCHAGH
ncbi:hypothetical protein G6F23_013635 [Rhizopus arrhizus]|nr:hypothetical protein G6F23_013635 [Rhizopus arrhizus]